MFLFLNNFQTYLFLSFLKLISDGFCIADFTFIHSKFLAPLPPSLSEFMCSLRLVFPNILDVNNLSKEVGPLRKAKNLVSTLSYLKRQFFVPIELEIPQEGFSL